MPISSLHSSDLFPKGARWLLYKHGPGRTWGAYPQGLLVVGLGSTPPALQSAPDTALAASPDTCALWLPPERGLCLHPQTPAMWWLFLFALTSPPSP